MLPFPIPSDILYEDNHCLAVNKPARLLIAGDQTGDPNLLDWAKGYLKDKYHKPGEVYLGLVHRLDRPVSGVVLFARTSKAAARLSTQFQQHTVEKIYHAVVRGLVPHEQVRCADYLLKDETQNLVSIVPAGTPGAKPALLEYRVIARGKSQTLLEIRLETGRSHQIRVQLASRGWPIVGDRKYGDTTPWEGVIGLHARELAFDHPVKTERIRLFAPYPTIWGGSGTVEPGLVRGVELSGDSSRGIK